ncbi:MAG: cyclic nucleotide-binding domain-containing protein [Burkholderiales bacterium]|nr:cyclic nucleotide-binding domain-containing protein [Burkholderiales bacterium]
MRDLLDKLLLLKRTATFSEVATDDLRVVAQELAQETCFAGERLFDLGDPSDRMYLIVEGKVGISIDTDPAAKEFISTLGPGDCFGEMGLFDDLPRSATAHVLVDSQLLALDKFKLRGLIVSYPELLLGLLRGLSHRLRGANEMIARGRN